MRLQGLIIAGLLAAVFGGAVFGNIAPTLGDLQIVTVQDRLVTFTLRAHDADIDPADPGAHPLRFVLLEGPKHGFLIGDLSDVRYEEPHTAYVELSYIPADGFVGTDFIVVAVIDPVDERATGTIWIDVVERRYIGLFSGAWRTAMTFDVSSLAMTAFWTGLTAVYRTGPLVLQGVADWRLDAAGDLIFDTLRLRGRVSISDLAVWSMLEFDPEAVSVADLFDHWQVATRLKLFGVGFNHTLHLTPSPSAAYQRLVVHGRVEGVDVANTLALGFDDAWGISFSRNTVQASWMWRDLRMRSLLRFRQTGFDRASLTVCRFPIPWLVRPPFGLYLNFGLSLTRTEKVLTPTLALRTAWIDCIRLLAAPLKTGTGGVELTGVSIYGIRFRHVFPDAVRLRAATSFDPNKNAAVTGLTDYFTNISISGPTASRCGRAGRWGVETYFQADDATLFDWGMTVFDFSLGLSNAFSMSTEIVVRSGTFGGPLLEWTIGWKGHW